MGLKKYEIITVGGNKRVRALRSWRVQDRYVNIGDVGGIVYDEKTLSQDGACWLFKGNFGFPGARIGGDSVVDVGEYQTSVNGSPNVDILGTSALVGGLFRFTSDKTAENAITLAGANFEQGEFASYTIGQKPGGSNSTNYIRTKNPIFMGGFAVKLNLSAPGYRVLALVLDRDGFIMGTSEKVSGEGITMTVPAGQYFVLRVTKDPTGAIVPADATAAQIKFTETHETKLIMVDSRVEVNPATATAAVTLAPGGQNAIAAGIKYPDSVIQDSTVVINGTSNVPRLVRLMAELVNVKATIDATTADALGIGTYRNVKNLTFAGQVTTNRDVAARSLIQAYNCDNMVVNATNFPGLADAQTANMPFIFQGCNVPNGLFYHHAQVANTYKNIDFEKASVDLGKTTKSYQILVSSEAEGMYRIYSVSGSAFGALVESTDSVKSLYMATITPSYGTTIYKDAYFNGMFDFAGTNVFGNKVRSHPLAQVLNVQPRVAQGNFNATSVGGTITSVITTPLFVSTPVPFRINGAKGLTVNNLPAGIEALLFLVDQNNVITRFGSGAEALPAAALTDMRAFIRFKKSDNSPITPADLAGVTVTVYNGCKIVNTGETEVNMKGNIRVEDNATLVNASVTGTGYFGGNSIVYYNPTVWASLGFNGTVYMKDNTVFAPTALTGSCANVRMAGNAKFIGSGAAASLNLSFIMRDNAVIEGKANTQSGVVMSGNSRVAPTGIISASSRGVLVMKDNASIEANAIVIGTITLAGNYKQTVNKMWTGKRVIDSQDAPQYDNNVKTKYDF